MDLLGAPVAERVEAELSRFVDERVAGLATLGLDTDQLAAAARDAVLAGGKRLRPRFAYWGWRSTRSADEPDDDLFTAAAALELLHGSALVHDDVMDASATRRGRPAAHRSFADDHRQAGWCGDPESFGTAAAVLLGDLLLVWSDTLFARAALPPDARAVYDDVRQVLVTGQHLELVVQARGRVQPDEALRIARLKSGMYTVEGPLLLGAAAACAPAAVRAALARYARPLGEAFQLRDDVLGVFGDSRVTGKPTGDDLREGKRTVLVALARQGATPVQARALERDLGRADLDAAGVAALRELVRATGALEEVERRIAERTAAARAALDDAALSPDSRLALDGLAVAATRRRD